MPTPLRAVRVPDSIWQRALTVATKRGESLSEVIREALEAYADRHK